MARLTCSTFRVQINVPASELHLRRYLARGEANARVVRAHGPKLIQSIARATAVVNVSGVLRVRPQAHDRDDYS
jgi:hypothetical protein